MTGLAVAPPVRGRLTLDRTVVEKIAAQAAYELGPVGGVSGGLLKIGAHSDLEARPQASAVLAGNRAEIALRITLGYPVALRDATDQVRRRVVDQVRRTCGIASVRVDIDVVGFARPSPSGGLA